MKGHHATGGGERTVRIGKGGLDTRSAWIKIYYGWPAVFGIAVVGQDVDAGGVADKHRWCNIVAGDGGIIDARDGNRQGGACSAAVRIGQLIGEDII